MSVNGRIASLSIQLELLFWFRELLDLLPVENTPSGVTGHRTTAAPLQPSNFTALNDNILNVHVHEKHDDQVEGQPENASIGVTINGGPVQPLILPASFVDGLEVGTDYQIVWNPAAPQGETATQAGN